MWAVLLTFVHCQTKGVFVQPTYQFVGWRRNFACSHDEFLWLVIVVLLYFLFFKWGTIKDILGSEVNKNPETTIVILSQHYYRECLTRLLLAWGWGHRCKVINLIDSMPLWSHQQMGFGIQGWDLPLCIICRMVYCWAYNFVLVFELWELDRNFQLHCIMQVLFLFVPKYIAYSS